MFFKTYRALTLKSELKKKITWHFIDRSPPIVVVSRIIRIAPKYQVDSVPGSGLDEETVALLIEVFFHDIWLLILSMFDHIFH